MLRDGGNRTDMRISIRLAQMALNGTTSISIDAKAPRKFLTMRT